MKAAASRQQTIMSLTCPEHCWSRLCAVDTAAVTKVATRGILTLDPISAGSNPERSGCLAAQCEMSKWEINPAGVLIQVFKNISVQRSEKTAAAT